MLYVDWEKTQKRYIEYWNKENKDRPLMAIYAPKDGYVPKEIKAPEKIIDRWLDTEYVIKSSRENMAACYFGGEAYPIINPNLGPDIFGAFLGCDLEFGNDTSWASHILETWKSDQIFKFDPENIWWKKIKKMTEDVTADAKGDYFVGITDLHPGADGLVALRGPDNLCTDLYDYPEEVKKATFELFDIFKIATDELYKITGRNLKGSSNWMGIWHPEKWYVTSCDFICMISRDMFSEFILPELKAELDYLDASIFHLDGPGALKHLDALLELPDLNGIQWVYGAGQPTASHWIPVLQKIQNAGKMIQIHIVPEDLDVLLENIKPEGVMYNVWVNREDEAKALLKKADSYYKKKLY